MRVCCTAVGPQLACVLVRLAHAPPLPPCLAEPEVVSKARAGIPVTVQRRFDVYADVSKVAP